MNEDFEQVVENTVEAVDTAPAEKPDIETGMAAAYDKAVARQEAQDEKRRSFVRTEKGQFGSKVNAAKPAELPERQPAEVKPAQEQPQPAQEARQAPTYPTSLPPALREKLDQAAPELRDWVARREAESHKRITELGQDVAPIRQIAERFSGSLGGMPPAEAFEKLSAANEFLSRNPLEGLKWLAASYGVDLRQLAGDSQPVSDGHQQTQALVNHFAKDKPDWNELESDIAEQVHAILSSNPGLPPFLVLERAYERASRLNTTVSTRRSQMEKVEADKKARAEASKRAANAKRMASVNAKSTAGVSPAPSGSWQDTMHEVANRLMR